MAETHTDAAADTLDPADIVGQAEASHDRPLPAAVVDRRLGPQGRRLYRTARSGRPRRSLGAAAGSRAGAADLLLRQGGANGLVSGRPRDRAEGAGSPVDQGEKPRRPARLCHTLWPDGAVLDPLRDTYDHAFVLLALATVYALDRDAQIRSEIDALCHFLDTQLRSPHGGFHEGLPASMPRRQNPHMHLFEAMIAGFDATHDMVFQQRAGEFFAPVHGQPLRQAAARARGIFRGRLVEDRARQRRARTSGGVGLAAEGI